jgi:hypothetical protein
MRGHWRSWLILVVVTPLTIVSPHAAEALDCNSEQGKFVAVSRSTYGGMASNYVPTRTIASCGAVANTIYFAIGGTTFDYVEAGTRQYGAYPGTFVIFSEINWYPSPFVYSDYPTNDNPNRYQNEQYFSFNVSNLTGTDYQFKMQFSPGSAQTPWTTMMTTGFATENYGQPLSEISRYGNSDASAHVVGLKYRPVTGGWYGWDSLACAQNSIPDWDGVKYSNTPWGTHYAAITGAC